MKLLIMRFLYSPATSSLFGPDIPFSNAKEMQFPSQSHSHVDIYRLWMTGCGQSSFSLCTNQIIFADRGNPAFYSSELSIIETNRSEIRTMACGQKIEREREPLVWYQRLCGQRQSAHLEITGMQEMWRKFTLICIVVDTVLQLVEMWTFVSCLLM